MKDLIETQLRVFTECEINESLDASIRAGLVICFPHREVEFGQCRALGLNVPCYTAVMAEGDNAVGQVAVMDRTIRVGDETVRVAGVANVFVLPEYRGNGHVDKMLEVAMEEAKNRGFEFGFLFTHAPLDRIYARNGWVDVTDRECILVEDGLEMSMGPERLRMYYKLGETDFPAGNIHLQAYRW